MSVHHKVFRNGRLYDSMNPGIHAIKQIARSWAEEHPGDVFTVKDANGAVYYEVSYTVGPTLSSKPAPVTAIAPIPKLTGAACDGCTIPDYTRMLVPVVFRGVAEVRVPNTVPKDLKPELAKKYALCHAMATMDATDSPEEDACDEWTDACIDAGLKSVDNAMREWDATETVGVAGTWELATEE